jgi:ATP-dependent DNA ligase
MNKQTLYQKDTKGKIRVWSISVEESANGIVSIDTESGILNGVMIPTRVIIHEGLGSKSIFEQAVADAQTEINKKIKSGYVYDIKNVKEKSQTATIDKPSKGLVYDQTGKNGITLSKWGVKGNFMAQVKLDGWRFRIWTDGTECIYYTASGDVTLGFEHITKSILDSYSKYYDFFDGEPILLDGEIYNHELGFQLTASACGSTKHITAEKQKLRDSMNFYIFDILYKDSHEAPYSLRYETCEMFVSETVILTQGWIVEQNHEKIKELFELVLSNGYEGLILRNLQAKYEHKKSKQFLKYKPLIDEEFVVVGFEKSITGDTLGSLICDSLNGEFSTNLKGDIGTDKYKQFIWDNQEKFLGQLVTVEFLEYTDDNLPRLPRAKGFRHILDSNFN